MARTKQSGRKGPARSTGGKAPRSHWPSTKAKAKKKQQTGRRSSQRETSRRRPRPASRGGGESSPESRSESSPEERGRGRDRKIVYHLPMVALSHPATAVDVYEQLFDHYREAGGEGDMPQPKEGEQAFKYFPRVVRWLRRRGELAGGGIKKPYKYRPGQAAEIEIAKLRASDEFETKCAPLSLVRV